MAWYDEYIERREGYSGGYPTLKRVRVSVRIVVELSRQFPDFPMLCAERSDLTPDELRAALAYYKDHKELIEEDIERNRKAWEEVVAGKWQR